MSDHRPVDNSSASELLGAILRWLDESGHPYCVERNYQGYPDVLTGDVDLIVPEGQVVAIARGVQHLGEAMGWHCYVVKAWHGAAHVGLYKPVYPNRFALVVELFAGAGWRGLIYLPSSRILARREECGITWRPAPEHQAVITVMHHLLYNRRIPPKYREEVLTLVQGSTISFERELAAAFGGRLATFALKSICSRDWDALERACTDYQRSLAVRNMVQRPLGWATSLARSFLASRQTPPGVVLVVRQDREEERSSLCDALLEVADRWHLFLPPVRRVVDLCSGSEPHSGRKRKAIVHAVERGGVAIVGSDRAHELDLDPRLPYVFEAVSRGAGCVVRGRNAVGREVVLPAVAEGFCQQTRAEAVAFQIWDFLLDYMTHVRQERAGGIGQG